MAVERFPVEATHIMMFARAIGDENPVYLDPASAEAQAAGGVVAPPTFPMASMQFDTENVLRPSPGQPWFGSGREATGAAPVGAGGLHAEQSFTFHRPLRPGMVLRATRRDGETWTKESRRGGLLSFSEMFTDFHDLDGALVVTSRMVGVVTEIVPTREG